MWDGARAAILDPRPILAYYPVPVSAALVPLVSGAVAQQTVHRPVHGVALQANAACLPPEIVCGLDKPVEVLVQPDAPIVRA